ncbi:hypothetical protein TCAL_00313 [Tigriopus californicus]|uniref:TLC domain-containing protein n=1 Tax=Tigriopus californicus TaxID=6832 RepID=A0A553NET6_TIGCA|nr:TLC domain-containing protein 2-like [Tigriopus californicus]TRY63963.1 hypothetical protein TCAL_00313 [Tigriopus californicus]|eukprot:TCALIF_00313-PA protein Name:"Similar to tlcd2 TLC domain-containing protein 2 (Danio rerio)" AED:0.06 eAED:0.06 QI:0/-1/0/1/-1/1/1/0/321
MHPGYVDTSKSNSGPLPPEADPNFNPFLAYVSAGFSFFLVVNIITKCFVPESVELAGPRSVWKWQNILTSFIHSGLTGCLAPLGFYLDPNMCNDMIDAFNSFTHILISFSIGYFVFDFMDMYLYNKKKSTYELLFHHFCVISCFGVAAYTKHYLPYASLALVVEINSIFLHLRQLFIIQGVDRQSKRYRFAALANVITFVLFRILLLGWMTRWITMNRDNVPLVFFTMGSFGLAVITAMNAILFYRILKSDYLSSGTKSTPISPKKPLRPEEGDAPKYVSKDVNKIMHKIFDEDSESGTDERIWRLAAKHSKMTSRDKKED